MSRRIVQLLVAAVEAGQIDLLMRNGQEYVVVDWKRIKELQTDSRWGPLQYPLNHLPHCNYWLYSLQLNLYRFVLETEYGHQVSHMFLGIVHPSAAGPRLVSVPRLEMEIEALVAYETDAGRAQNAQCPFFEKAANSLR